MRKGADFPRFEYRACEREDVARRPPNEVERAHVRLQAGVQSVSLGQQAGGRRLSEHSATLPVQNRDVLLASRGGQLRVFLVKLYPGFSGLSELFPGLHVPGRRHQTADCVEQRKQAADAGAHGDYELKYAHPQYHWHCHYGLLC